MRDRGQKRDTERIDRDLRLDADDGGPGIRLLYTTPESSGRARASATRFERARATDSDVNRRGRGALRRQLGPRLPPAYLALKDFATTSRVPACPSRPSRRRRRPRSSEQIVSALGLRDPALIATSLNRRNLRYEVIRRESFGGGHSEVGTGVGTGVGTEVGTEDVALAHLAAMAKETKERWPGSAGIVYARTRAECERLAALLQDKHDVDCEVFHAGRTREALARTQGNWAGGDVHCVVATVAFGMGVDKADVRFVAHWGPPTTLEGLYQESGRAGRDSNPARCVMYVGSNELDELRKVTGGGGDAHAAVDAYARRLAVPARRIARALRRAPRGRVRRGRGEVRRVRGTRRRASRGGGGGPRISDRAAERRMEDAVPPRRRMPDSYGGTAGSGDWLEASRGRGPRAKGAARADAAPAAGASGTSSRIAQACLR